MIARHHVVNAEIDESSLLCRGEGKAIVLGRLTDGYYIEKGDLLAIENALHDALKMATEACGETMRS